MSALNPSERSARTAETMIRFVDELFFEDDESAALTLAAIAARAAAAYFKRTGEPLDPNTIKLQEHAHAPKPK